MISTPSRCLVVAVPQTAGPLSTARASHPWSNTKRLLRCTNSACLPDIKKTASVLFYLVYRPCEDGLPGLTRGNTRGCGDAQSQPYR